VIRLRAGALALALIAGRVAGLPSAARSGTESSREERFEFAGPHMGTVVRITLYARGEQEAARASASAFARIAQLDARLSDYRDDSELTALSRRSGTGPVAVSEDLFRVLAAAQGFARASGGAFDATAGPLSVLWRQARRQRRLPDRGRVDDARARIGYAKLALDAEARTAALRVPGMQLDLGGIAKGFAADEAVKVLAAAGITRALVACGGDIAASDPPPGERGWRVNVVSLEGAAPGPTLLLRNGGVSTSGDAEQFVVVGGIRYSHIYDPRTGQAMTGRRTVTVRAADALTTDALATAVSVMGASRGLALVDRTPGASAWFVEDSGHGITIHTSSRWRGEAR